ncbi:unnamed protein product [Calypogeia fissa]
MAGVRRDCKISVGPSNAMSDGFRDFAVVTPGGEPCLPVEVKKLNWFRNSEAEPLRDLVDRIPGGEILHKPYRHCSNVGSSTSDPLSLKAEEPTLLQCLYCIIDMAIQEMDSFKEFEPDLKHESSNQQQVESAGSPRPDDDDDWCPPDESGADDDAVSRPETRSDTRKKSKLNEETQLQLHETRASDLHLDRLPFTSDGWSGNVVLGRVKGCRAVVRLAIDSYCSFNIVPYITATTDLESLG